MLGHSNLTMTRISVCANTLRWCSLKGRFHQKLCFESKHLAGIISTPVWACCDFEVGAGSLAWQVAPSGAPWDHILEWGAMRHYETRASVWMQLALASSEGCEYYGYLLTHLGWVFFLLQRQFSSKKNKTLVRLHLNKLGCKQIQSNELADYSQIQTLICLLLNVTKHYVRPVKIPVVSILDKYGWSFSRACRRENIWMPAQHFTVKKTWVLKQQNLILIRRCSIFIKNILDFGKRD